MIRRLEHIIDPERLLLAWQPSDTGSKHRMRRVVGCLEKGPAGPVFRYLKDSEDFRAAQKAGFEGYPAFRIDAPKDHEGAIESFLRRVPPRKREDFGEYLEQHRLPDPFPYSDMALLGYTGAKLPSDSFSLIPDFSPDTVPCDLLLEVAGVRHCTEDIASLHLGDPVDLVPDPKNAFDSDAIAVRHQGKRIGYVNRVLRGVFQRWLRERKVEASIERRNGKPERPMVYLLVRVR